MRRSLAIALLALASACDDRKEYAGLELEELSSPPEPVSIEPEAITLVAGEAVLISARPRSSGQRYEDSDLLTLSPDDEDVFDVYAGTADREFVLVGLRPGRSCLEVRVERQREECIDVRVIAAEQ